MEKRKVLVFIDWYLPAFKAGGPIRSVHNLVERLKSQFDFYILTGDRDYLDKVPFKGIRLNFWIDFNGYQLQYLSPKNQNLSHYKSILKEIKPEVVYINGLFSYNFSILPLFALKNIEAKKVIAPRGMLSNGSFSEKRIKKALYIRIAKIFGMYKGIIFHATSDQEYNNSRFFFNKNRIFTANNFASALKTEFVPKYKEKGVLKVLNLGRVSPEKNNLFALEVIKSCQLSQIDYDIIGPISDEPYWNKCKELMEQMPKNTIVNYKGVVKQEGISSILEQYHVLLLPSSGENFGHAIVESMTSSCVPVISDQTQWKNLEFEGVGFDIPLEDKVGFSKAIETLGNMDAKEFNRLSKRSYEYGKKIVEAEGVKQSYLQMFKGE